MSSEPIIAPRLMFPFGDLNREATFIEIGANDGVLFDPLRPYIERYEWRGVLVEPIPHIFERLRERYERHSRIRLERAAIASADGRRSMYYVREPGAAGTPKWAEQIASFHREHVLAHLEGPDPEPLIGEIEVPCLSFNTLCARHGIETLDLLLIDAEGAEAEILAGLDLSMHSPRLLVFEHEHIATEALVGIERRLMGAGYELVRDGLDTWALDMRPEDELSRRWREAIAERRG